MSYTPNPKDLAEDLATLRDGIPAGSHDEWIERMHADKEGEFPAEAWEQFKKSVGAGEQADVLDRMAAKSRTIGVGEFYTELLEIAVSKFG